MPQNGLKMGSFHPFVHPKWSRMRFGKMHFCPIFDPFLVPKQPIFKAFGDFRRNKMGYHKLKTVQNTCFSVAHGPGSFLIKVIFLPPLHLVNPFGHPPVWA